MQHRRGRPSGPTSRSRRRSPAPAPRRRPASCSWTSPRRPPAGHGPSSSISPAARPTMPTTASTWAPARSRGPSPARARWSSCPAWREAAWEGGGWPTSFQDVACAIGVARAIGPAYGGDPDRVTLGGHSTGGWPPAVLALTPTPFTPEPGSCDETAGSLRPDAVVMSDGNLDEVTAQSDGRDYVVGFLGGDRAARPDEWAAADPFALVKRYPAGPDAIPSLLIYGEYRPVVSPQGLAGVPRRPRGRGLRQPPARDPGWRPHRGPGQEGDHRRDHGHRAAPIEPGFRDPG